MQELLFQCLSTLVCAVRFLVNPALYCSSNNSAVLAGWLNLKALATNLYKHAVACESRVCCEAALSLDLTLRGRGLQVC